MKKYWVKFAIQILKCVTISRKHVANCDAMPVKIHHGLNPVDQNIYHIVYKTTSGCVMFIYIVHKFEYRSLNWDIYLGDNLSYL